MGNDREDLQGVRGDRQSCTRNQARGHGAGLQSCTSARPRVLGRGQDECCGARALRMRPGPRTQS